MQLSMVHRGRRNAGVFDEEMWVGDGCVKHQGMGKQQSWFGGLSLGGAGVRVVQACGGCRRAGVQGCG
jgi:hypothetical protein